MRATFTFLLLLLLMVALLVGCAPLCGYLPFLDETFSVPPQSLRTLTIDAKEGDLIEGIITIKGGEKDLVFREEDPDGIEIYNSGTVYDRHDFQVDCPKEGTYTLQFDNSFSPVKKDVYIHYRARPISQEIP